MPFSTPEYQVVAILQIHRSKSIYFYFWHLEKIIQICIPIFLRFQINHYNKKFFQLKRNCSILYWKNCLVRTTKNLLIATTRFVVLTKFPSVKNFGSSIIMHKAIICKMEIMSLITVILENRSWVPHPSWSCLRVPLGIALFREHRKVCQNQSVPISPSLSKRPSISDREKTNTKKCNKLHYQILIIELATIKRYLNIQYLEFKKWKYQMNSSESFNEIFISG